MLFLFKFVKTSVLSTNGFCIRSESNLWTEYLSPILYSINVYIKTEMIVYLNDVKRVTNMLTTPRLTK